jgi:hypothetical protein
MPKQTIRATLNIHLGNTARIKRRLVPRVAALKLDRPSLGHGAEAFG